MSAAGNGRELFRCRGDSSINGVFRLLVGADIWPIGDFLHICPSIFPYALKRFREFASHRVTRGSRQQLPTLHIWRSGGVLALSWNVVLSDGVVCCWSSYLWPRPSCACTICLLEEAQHSRLAIAYVLLAVAPLPFGCLFLPCTGVLTLRLLL